AFERAGDAVAHRVARWNGVHWQPLGSGLDGDVQSFTVYNNNLIAGGTFTTAGGATMNHVAQWDGSGWHPVGSGIGGPNVYALAVYNGALIAGGEIGRAH